MIDDGQMFDVTSSPDLIDDPGSLRHERSWNPFDKDLQRAEGSGRMVVTGSNKGTRIVDVFQRAPIRILFPRDIRGAIEEAVLVDTAGGIAGGDVLEIAVTAHADASITVTTQAAEKIYRALNRPAR